MNLFLHARVSDEPVILISGAEKAICGSTIQFNSHVKPANTSERSGNWKKNRTSATEQIYITSRKYCGSRNRQFVINSVEKEDEGKYKAFFPRGSNRKIHEILSKGTLFFCFFCVFAQNLKILDKKVTYRVTIIISRDDSVFVDLNTNLWVPIIHD